MKEMQTVHSQLAKCTSFLGFGDRYTGNVAGRQKRFLFILGGPKQRDGRAGLRNHPGREDWKAREGTQRPKAEVRSDHGLSGHTRRKDGHNLLRFGLRKPQLH